MPFGMVPGTTEIRNFFSDLFREDEKPAPAKTKKKRAGFGSAIKPKATTKEQEIRNLARRRIAERERQSIVPRNDFLASARRSMTLGIPEIVGAAITAPFTDRSFSEELALNRAESDILRERSTTGNVLGLLVGGTGLASAGSATLRAAGQQIGGRAGQTLQGLTKLQQGQRARNIAKLAAGGAAGGATEAALRGNDVGEAAIIGAVGAPALVGLGKGAMRVLELPWAATGASSAMKGVIRRLTNTSSEELERRAVQARAQTGMEPTVYELLDPADQKRILEDVVGPNANVGDEAAQMIAQRLQEISGGAQARMGQITRPRMRQAEQEIAGRLASARGTAVPEDAATAAQAVRSPEALERLRSQEASAIMAPFDNQIAVGSVDDLVPTVPVNRDGTIAQIPDPEIQSVIRSVSGSARLRQDGGITVKEITDIRRSLKSLAGRGDINSGPAQAALDYVDEIVADRLPDAAAAIARMDEAFAGASRIAEGAQVGAKTRLRDTPGSVGTSDTQSQLIRNAFDTPEGATGRAIGQTNRLLEMFGGNTGETARAIRQVSSSSTVQRAIAENIGAREGQAVTGAAQAFDKAISTLNRALPRAEGAGQSFDDIDALVDSFTLVNPVSFPTAKAWAARRLLNATPMPERMARNISEMLFSRDSNQVRRALNMLNSTVEDAASFRHDLGLALVLGQMTAAVNEGTRSEPAPATEEPAEIQATEEIPDFEQMSDEELEAFIQQNEQGVPDFEQMSDEELEAFIQQNEQASGGDYGAELQARYQNYDPAFLDLLQRVEQQESGGNPNAVSSAGAIGLMQVMPDTAPEAARLAGVPFDENAYYNDPSYQRLLGAAYLEEMFRQFDGNAALALAAYNAGPGRVRQALRSGDRWYANLPTETQNYLRALL